MNRGFLVFLCCVHENEETEWEIVGMEPLAAIVAGLLKIVELRKAEQHVGAIKGKGILDRSEMDLEIRLL